MITVWNLITRKNGMSQADFEAYSQEKHAPLTTKAARLRRYIQNFVTDKEQRGVAFPRVPVDADLMEEVWFDNLHDLNLCMGAHGKAIADDYAHFAEDVKTLVTIKNQIIPIADKPLLKRVSFITRKPELDFEHYKHEWWDVHGDYVRQFKGVRGYCQSLPLDRIVNGVSADYDAVPFDGIVELYFDDLKGLEADFASEVGKTAQGHGRTFLNRISTYIVDPRVVKG